MNTKRARSVWTNVVGITGLLLAGYVILSSLPDVRHYARIARM
jgi:hypothetical protein